MIQPAADHPASASLATLLRLHRRRAGLTQEQLGEQAGFSPEYIRKLEGGTRRPTIASLHLLAEALELDGVSRSRLLEARTAWSAGSPPRTEARAAGPRTVSSFIGRQRELAEITSLLTKPEVRIMSLTGPGGAGKTRLALEVSRSLGSEFSDGVFFLELASLTEPTHVLPAIRRAIGAEEDAFRRSAFNSSGAWRQASAAGG